MIIFRGKESKTKPKVLSKQILELKLEVFFNLKKKMKLGLKVLLKSENKLTLVY